MLVQEQTMLQFVKEKKTELESRLTPVHPTIKLFLEFNARNPHVYDTFVDCARTLRNKGFNRYSLAGLAGHLRYVQDLSIEYEGGFKLRCAFLSFYARLIMMQEKDLEGFFVIRKSCADELFNRKNIISAPEDLNSIRQLEKNLVATQEEDYDLFSLPVQSF